MNAHDHHSFDTDAEAARLEREAEGLLAFTEHAASMLVDLVERNGRGVRRVLDVGSGPGVATCVLAQRFPSARVVAVDSSPTMLEHATARAARLGLAERVGTCRADIPDGLGTVGTADVAWASMVLHHVDDRATALRALRELLRPGGLLAVVEHVPVNEALAAAGFEIVTDVPLGPARQLYVATST